MTERWRKKLEGLDGASPSDDVFERAKQGPSHPDEALPGPRMSARVVTVIAAFVVFALAISVFAIPALRMNDTPAGGASQGLMPLWPSQSSDQLQRLQEGADAGTADWALSPKVLTQKFVQETMGWSDAVVSADPAASCFVVNGPTGPSPVACRVLPVGGFSAAAGIPTALFSTPPTPGFGGPSATYAVQQCDGCPNREWVQVYQPLEQGDGGIWAVLQAQGMESLSVTPGQVVHNGASISAGFVTYRAGSTQYAPTLGYGSCGQSAASSTFHAPAQSDGMGIQSEVDLTGGCEGEQPGYVWAATAPELLVDTGGGVIDPFNGGHPSLVSLTAAPVTMVFPTPAAETTEPSSPTLEPSSWSTFDGGLGFTMELPADWGTTAITDEIVVNAPGGDPYVQINRVDEAPRDDSSFPLNFADYEGVHQPHFYGDGQTFIIQWLTGTADPLTPEQSAVVERIVESIRFEPWTVGDTRNTFTAIGKALRSATAQWITYRGENYLSYIGGEGDGGRVVYGPAPRCLSGAPQPLLEVRETGVAAITCQDGQSGQWRFDSGEADSANDQRFAEPLPKHRAILSWDGFLLGDLSSTIS